MSSQASSNAGTVEKITGANKLHILMEKGTVLAVCWYMWQ